MSKLGIIRTRWAAIGAAVAVTAGAAGLGGLNSASADVASGDRPVFVSINPCRLVDTRIGLTVGPQVGPIGPAEILTVTAHGSNGECIGASALPTDALSLAMNVTAVAPTSNTFLTFWGDGPNPGTSNLNPRAGGDPTPNAVNTPLSSAGTFNIFNNRGDVDVIVDVNGYYAHHNHNDQYASLGHVHDDRYLQRQDVNVGYHAFEFDEASSNWSTNLIGYGLNHTSSGARECIFAPVQLPVGAPVSDVRINYLAASADSDTEARLLGYRNEAFSDWSPGSVDTYIHQVATSSGDLPATGAGNIASLSLPRIADVSVRDGYGYVLRVCARDTLLLVGMTVEL